MLQLRDRGFKYSLRRWLRISGLWIRRLAELDPRFPAPVPGIIFTFFVIGQRAPPWQENEP